MSMFDCTHCGDRHHVNDFCATGPMSAEPVAPTTRETADHAELLARAKKWVAEMGEFDDLNPSRAEAYIHGSFLLSEIAALRGEVNRLRNAASKSNEEVCQSLGKALGYPWFKDDQANFPGSTESDGVCVGDHVAESIADEAARRLTQAERQRDELRGEAVKGFALIHTMLMTPSVPRQSAGEVANTFLDRIANQGADQ